MSWQLPINDHPDSGRIARGLDACIQKGFLYSVKSLRVTRFATPQYATRTRLVDMVGSLKNGGRWNTRERFGVLYSSMDDQTAQTEWSATLQKLLLGSPVVFAHIDIRLQRFLDLRSAPVQDTLVLSRQQMIDTDWDEENEHGREAITQAVSRLARERDIEALLVPSAVSGAGSNTNVLVFMDRLLPGSSWEIVNPSALPSV